jgi:WD40 repeat protein
VVAIGGTDGIFRVWRAATGKQILAAPHSARDAQRGDKRDAPLVDVAISAKGRFISVSRNGSLAFWGEREPGGDPTLIAMNRGPYGYVRDAAIGPTDGELAVASDRALSVSRWYNERRFWIPLSDSNGGPDGDAEPRGASPVSLTFSLPGSRTVGPTYGVVAALWSDGEIRFYNPEGGRWGFRLPAVAPGASSSARRLMAFNLPHTHFAATDGDRVVQVWRLGQDATPVTLTVPRGPIRSLWFTPDGGSVVVSIPGDRQLRRFPVPATSP